MSAAHVSVRLYGDLADLAGTGRPAPRHEVPIGLPRSVKDVVESLGVPHTEVDLLLVNGASVGFAHRVGAGDRVSAFPVFFRLDVEAVSRVRPAPLAEARFVLDVHLGALAGRLRLLGFDTAYRNDFDDAELVDVAAGQRRVLLTRDRGLLMRSAVTHGYLVRSEHPDAQALEVVRRFRLFDRLAPFTRCLECGGALAPVAKADIEHRLDPGTRARHDEFVACADCDHLYWEGSHHPRLQRFVEEIQAAPISLGGRGGRP